MKRILVGVDGSKESRAAARMAAEIARATGSQLSIAYAVAAVPLPTGAPELVAHINDRVLLGSVADRLVQISSKPVLVVR